ncbi:MULTISPECIES: DUF4349 domain-containing protein [Paenibacillus]|uniref:DUF4349 domain-containing protein n=1 Tax=Paenibacillus TaxID=44249 RepID=UPI0022B923E7|nr:DUF4349 domain-containing protein [Paenibacillus caseinilyticus]MCZ8518765.1 DUF4349 domain-containing protein [Paenibacillus caseinilyticus]
MNKKKIRRLWKRGQAVRGLAAAWLLAACLAGCGGADQSSSSAEQLPAEAKMVSPDTVAPSGAAKADQLQVQNESEAAGGGAGGGAVTGQPPAGMLEAPARQIIYKANLSMRVDTYTDAVARIQEVVRQSGAYVLSSSENTAGPDKNGFFIIKVPANGFQPLIKLLEGIDPQLQRSIEGQDVTEEFVDLTARLKAKQAVEARLLSFIEKAAKADELVAFSAELGKVQEDIERITGRMRYLEQHVAFSTVELRVEQKVSSADRIHSEERGPLWSRASRALDSTLTVMGFLLEWTVVSLVGALPVLLLAGGVGGLYWFYKRWRRGRAESAAAVLLPGSSSESAQVGDLPKDEPKESEK